MIKYSNVSLKQAYNLALCGVCNTLVYTDARGPTDYLYRLVPGGEFKEYIRCKATLEIFKRSDKAITLIYGYAIFTKEGWDVEEITYVS